MLNMLNFMNSKLPDKLVVSTSKTAFTKKVNPMKYPVQTYILVRIWNLLFMYFTAVSRSLDHEIYTKYDKKHLTWLKLYLVIISALELKVSKQKKHLSLTLPKPFVPFHRVTFDHSIAWVILIDKPNKS